MKYLVLLSMFAVLGLAGCDTNTATTDDTTEVTPADTTTDMETPATDTTTSPTGTM